MQISAGRLLLYYYPGWQGTRCMSGMSACQVTINECLERLHSWCDKWDMEINYAKTTFAHITRRKHVFPFQYRIGNGVLTKVSSFRYLGVVISDDLNWRSQTENVCSASYKKLCFLRVKLRNATKEVKLMAYKTFIRPVLEYACVVWRAHQKGPNAELERIQRLAARFICSRYKKKQKKKNRLAYRYAPLMQFGIIRN